MDKILLFLSGKKTIIVSIIMILAGYCMEKGYIDSELFTAIGAICGLFGRTTSHATKQIFKDQ